MKHILALSLTTLLASTGIAAAQDYGLTPAQSAQSSPSGGFVVYFALDKATLNADAKSVIAQAAQEFQRTGSARISVRGHTDTSGSSGYNQALSERREQAVANELMALGVPQAAITGEALGETDPAVPTGDGVPEAANRRVDIAIAQPPAPVAAVTPAPAPVPAPAPQPAPQREMPKWMFSAGPFYGFNLEDEAGHTSQLAGLNLALDVPVNNWLSAGVEQAGFYHFDTPNDGAGGRTVASIDFTFGDPQQFQGRVGGNFGYLYGSGIDDDLIVGPEIGFTAGRFIGKVAYDIPFNRDGDEGIINTTFGFRF